MIQKNRIQWKRRLVASAVAGVVALAAIPTVPEQITAYAADADAVFSEGEKGEVSIGNSYITRVFDTTGDKLKTKEIDNKRANLTFAPAEGSEEFIIELKEGSDKEIRSSELTLETDEIAASDTDTGILVEFPFEKIAKNNVDWDITMKVSMDDGKHYMRKFLEIEVSDRAKAVIDYIDLEHMVIGEDVPTDNRWTINMDTMAAGEGGTPGYIMALGQPVYIQAMFFGSEFPATVTEIRNNVAYMRYYSGKSFEQLKKDNQMTLEDVYVTWPTVAGAARSTDMNVIQSDFYSYIRDIATETDLRMQYNSWYDNMMGINDANIEEAFVRIEKGLSETGVPPLDSYVVDDGWINYNSDKYNDHDVNASGTTNNVTGFWEFNSKFPQGFGPASKLAQSFGSHFGVWVGPRGGYSHFGTLGHMIEDAGNGAYNQASADIDVGDRRYIRKLTEYFCSMQDAYKVNYWKLDGFASAACNDASHEHMVGGLNGMYYYSDLWEGWTDLFETIRANAKQNGIDNLWINLTCYVSPSPWMLQWGNSIWLQNSADMSRTDVDDSVAQSSDLDRMLSYRHGRYFDFVKTRQFQLPLQNVYNHDPVFGKTGTGLANQLSDEQFQTYLYMMATRGTAFWELYYSPSMMDEGQKWAINAEALSWLRKNYHILKNAKLIGNTPANDRTPTGNTYGFSCWDDEEGIISMRNSGVTAKTLTYTLDRGIGVAESLSDKRTLYAVPVLSYKSKDTEVKQFHYGETVTVTLEPGEAKIWQFSTKQDTTAANVQSVQTTDDAEGHVTVKATFDERIKTSGVTSSSGTAAVTADGRSVTVTLNNAVSNGAKISCTLTGVTDLSGNTKSYTIETVYHADGVMAKAGGVSDLKDAAGASAAKDGALDGRDVLTLKKAYEVKGEAYVGTSDFSVSAYIKTTGKGASLIAQGGEYALALDADGRLTFTVGGRTVTSNEKVNDGEWRHVAGVREKNGNLKVYVDGTLENSLYVPDIKDIKTAAVTVGGNGLELQISEATVRGETLALSEIEAGAETVGAGGNQLVIDPDTHKVTLQANKISIRSAKTDEDVSNGSAAAMVDGDAKDATSYASSSTSADFENEVKNGTSVYFEVDLGKKVNLEKVKLWRFWSDNRKYKDTIIVASEDATFDTTDYVLFSTVTDEAHACGVLTQERLANPDSEYAETEDGKEFKAADGTKARYIRIYMRGSDANGGHGGCHICEFEVYGTAVDPVVKKKNHKVTFYTTGGNKIDALKVAEGSAWQLPADPAREGYRFDGWCTDVNCVNAFNGPSPLTDDLCLFAKWKKLYKVNIYSYDSAAFDSLEVEENTAIGDMSAAKRPGTTFEGWYTDYERKQKLDPSMKVDRNITLYPQYKYDPVVTEALEGLRDEIAGKSEVEKGDYSDESWSRFESALQAAQSATRDAQTKAELEAALKALQAAYAGLKKADSSNPDTPQKATPVKLAAPTVSVQSTWKGVQVKWNAVSGAVSYTVSRNGKAMKTVTATSWLDEKPLGGKVNTYQVTANGDGVKTLASAPGSGATGKLPKAATKLKAKKKGKKVVLSWKKVKKASYVVLRATKKNGPYKKIKVVKKNTYTDKKAKGKNVFYKVVVKSKKLYAPASKAKKVKL